MNHEADLKRIREALLRSGEILERYAREGVRVDEKSPGDPVTEADLAVDALLKGILPQPGDGWLSEETADDPSRLESHRVWIVDPLDGTREFVTGIPEWCVSIGLVEDGQPVAGGIYNPLAGELVLGAVDSGVTLNDSPVSLSSDFRLSNARVLASRSEVRRGEWEHYPESAFHLRPTGSVAYKMGCVAAGLCEATWTLVPKHEWDVAAGAALVLAAGGEVCTKEREPARFNQPVPLFQGMIATAPRLMRQVWQLLDAV